LEKKVTLKELAKILNVSVATVSKALNDSYDISEETKIRVKKKAKELNYVPNIIAQSLKLKKSFSLGVIIPNITDEFFARAVHGITKEAKENRYKTLISISNEELQSEIESVDIFLNSNIDGLLISLASETQTKNQYEHIKKIQDQGIPIVLFDRVTDAVDCDKITIDDFKSAYDATYFLLRKGCKNIIFLSTISHTSVCELRKRGYEQALKDSKIKVGATRFLEVTHENLEFELKSFLEVEEVDGILGADEYSAVASLHLVQNLGYRVPDQISVIGFTNGSLTKFTVPSLTAISQHSELMGKNAVQTLLSRIQKGYLDQEIQHKIVQTDLIQRKSTPTKS
jgi:LacI family transcriptional regulator